MRYPTGAVLGPLVIAAAALSDPVPGRAQEAAQVDQGQKVYATAKCASCHSIGGKGNKKGPLDDAGSKLTVDELREWIVNPKAMTKKTNSKRKPIMKEHPKLTPVEIDALVAYMQTLKKG
jgi:mono/diheme cytochrome c family protein